MKLHALRKIAEVAAVAGGWMILAAVGVTVFEVLVRTALSFSLSGADEITGYLFAIGTAWSLAYVAIDKGHVRVDVVRQLLPQVARISLDFIGMSMLSALLGLVSWSAFKLVSESAKFGSRSVTPLNFPLVVPQTLWLIGLAFSLVTVGVLLIGGIVAATRSDFDEVERLLGQRDAEPVG